MTVGRSAGPGGGDGAPAFDRTPHLISRIARVLRDGPVPTLDLAREALGLRGNPEAASRVVFALLGNDPRFRVDRKGAWSLADGSAGPGSPLRELRYAVVDVETTGGAFARGHRVTEVAVVHVDEGRITGRFETLVDPERPIPPRIQSLTGITDEMVAGAPPFGEVAADVASRLRGRTFVAHNAGFDWAFVSGELERATGRRLQAERLCTVRLGRLLVPALRSHALGPLTDHFGIRVPGRHRAGGDALATARLLLHLFDEADAAGLGDRPSLEAALASPRAWRRSRRQMP